MVPYGTTAGAPARVVLEVQGDGQMTAAEGSSRRIGTSKAPRAQLLLCIDAEATNGAGASLGAVGAFKRLAPMELSLDLPAVDRVV